jgi:hypothetical protein
MILEFHLNHPYDHAVDWATQEKATGAVNPSVLEDRAAWVLPPWASRARPTLAPHQ